MMKSDQSDKRECNIQKFRQLEQQHLKEMANRNSSMPKHDEKTLQEIKKNRLQRVNQ